MCETHIWGVLKGSQSDKDAIKKNSFVWTLVMILESFRLRTFQHLFIYKLLDNYLVKQACQPKNLKNWNFKYLTSEKLRIFFFFFY